MHFYLQNTREAQKDLKPKQNPIHKFEGFFVEWPRPDESAHAEDEANRGDMSKELIAVVSKLTEVFGLILYEIATENW